MTKNWVLYAVMTTAVGFGGYLLGGAKSPAVEQERRPLARAAHAEPKRAKPEVQIRTVERIIERQPSVAAASDEAEPDEAEPDDEEAQKAKDEARALADQELMDRAHAALDERFADQRADRAWSGDMEGTIGGALRSVLPQAGLNLENVECRSDLCVSTLTHETPQPPQEVIMAFIMKAIPGLETRIRYDEGRTTIYSIRRDDALAQSD